MKRIGLIGHIANNLDFFDGQTVSTRLWKNEMKRYSTKPMVVVDTYNYRKNFVPMFTSWLKCMFCCSDIVIMLSINGLRIFLPLIYFSNKVFKKKIYHRVIGGNLLYDIEMYPQFIKYMNSFEVNWVQSRKQVEILKKKGLLNARYLENFRNTKPVLWEEKKKYTGAELFKFCTFSRVAKKKGITDAIEAINIVNSKYEKTICVLDIYGPIEDDYKDEFSILLEKYEKCVTYCGCVRTEEAVNYLKEYFMHLFPTTWEGEGFPGTIVDCYNAGLPTIASDWAYNTECIIDGETGYLYPYKELNRLSELIEYSINNCKIIEDMSLRCLQESSRYNSSVVMKRINKEMTEGYKNELYTN